MGSNLRHKNTARQVYVILFENNLQLLLSQIQLGYTYVVCLTLKWHNSGAFSPIGLKSSLKHLSATLNRMPPNVFRFQVYYVRYSFWIFVSPLDDVDPPG